MATVTHLNPPDVSIDYDHSKNLHTVNGPKAGLPILFPQGMPRSLLDVGCGTGTWLRAASELGVSDLFGIDGMDIPADQLLIESDRFKKCDLTAPVQLGRSFDAVLCLEVAEHLDASCASTLVQTLVKHSHTIVFSAACPGQPGQHHINCQWPQYWQDLFNASGYGCDDSLRWRIWNDSRIEPWYRQNIFVASRSDSAGQERRIPSLHHPEMIPMMVEASFAEHAAEIENGRMPARWYLKALPKAFVRKIRRKLT